MIIHRPLLSRIAITLALCTGLLALACVQPEERPRPAAEPPTIDRGQLRERLASRLERSKASCEALESAITRLDNNEEPAAVLVSLGPVLREDMSTMFEPHRAREPFPRDGAISDADPHSRITLDPDAINEFIDRELPWLAERLNQIEAERPGSRLEMIRRLTPQIEEIINTSNENPELAKLHIEQFRLGSEIIETMRRVRRAVDAGEMTEDSAKAAIIAIASQQVDLRERITRTEIESLRKRLAERDAELSAQIADRDRVIANMTERLFRRGFDMRRDPQNRGQRRNPPDDTKHD